MTTRRLVALGRRLAYLLRHDAALAQLWMDRHGNVPVGVMTTALDVPLATLREVARADDKGRFLIEGDQVRALYGHSVPVEPLERVDSFFDRPGSLYHGTAIQHLAAIQADGLIPGQRQFVHLATEPEAAREVGSRYGDPVVLHVDPTKVPVLYRASDTVWLAEPVPPRALAVYVDNNGDC